MSFPRYPEYKDSGVEWFHSVPSHWEIQPCRAVFFERDERNDLKKCEDYLSLMANIGVIPYEEKGDVGNKKPEDLGKCKQVFEGDLVINSMNYGIGSYGLSSYRGVCSPVYIVLTPKKDRIEERFAFRILESKQFQRYAQSFGNGILEHRAAINWDVLKVIGIPIPTILEQGQILMFLDIQIGKIDSLIREQENLIEVLKEKRDAVITDAVLCRSDTSLEMKPSGIDWLGQIPLEWDVTRLKWDLEFLTSGSRGWADHYSDDGSLFIRIGNLTRDGINLDFSDIQRVTVPDGVEGERTKVKPGDVLFSITAYLGSVAVVPEEIESAYVSQHVALARLKNKRLIPEWVAFVTKSLVGKTYLESQGYGGTKIQLSLDDVANIPIPHPSIEEQRKIVESLRYSLVKFDALHDEAMKVIEFLLERRSALITAAVTGQIDVRRSLSEMEVA